MGDSSILNQIEDCIYQIRESLDEPMNLGQLISAVQKAIPDCPEDNPSIEFDFGRAAPTEFNSFRWNYRELAIGYSGKGSAKAKDFLAACKKASVSTFQGYKGGEFEMDSDTSVWVACRGCISNTRITQVIVKDGDTIVLVTDEFEF